MKVSQRVADWVTGTLKVDVRVPLPSYATSAGLPEGADLLNEPRPARVGAPALRAPLALPELAGGVALSAEPIFQLLQGGGPAVLALPAPNRLRVPALQAQPIGAGGGLTARTAGARAHWWAFRGGSLRPGTGTSLLGGPGGLFLFRGASSGPLIPRSTGRNLRVLHASRGGLRHGAQAVPAPPLSTPRSRVGGLGFGGPRVAAGRGPPVASLGARAPTWRAVGSTLAAWRGVP